MNINKQHLTATVDYEGVKDALHLTLTSQLHSPPQATFPIVKLNGIFAHVFLCGLCDLQPQLLSHHTTLYTVREGDGRIPVTETKALTVEVKEAVTNSF